MNGGVVAAARDRPRSRRGGTVELANTAGIELLGERRFPEDADTTGFGQAIAAALDHGVSRLVLGIGSSASTDGGLWMLRGLGGTFTDAAGLPVVSGVRGLAAIASADLTVLRPLPDGGASVITDVTNPLLGSLGAAAVFGPQKGMDAAGVQCADEGLRRLVDLLGGEPGSGAAGGTGYALRLWGARLAPGAEAIAGLVRLREAVADADLVVTGEGQFDSQSLSGKVPVRSPRLLVRRGWRWPS
ncbi:glycerate kinase [Paenarthrobacter sp. YIM B13468]|uniref:glycerate kinase n=1 Tax=Paenarthrobacter sp. YIM B13468 TaxID=3366295 RepID=UPI00366DFFB7